MARLFSCGFETGNTLDWDSGGSATGVTTSPRHGSYCFGSHNSINITKVLPSTYSELYFRAGVRTAGETWVRFLEGTTVHLTVHVSKNANTITARRGDTGGTILAAANVSNLDQWQCLEIYLLISDDAGTGRVVVVLNGDYANPLIDYTGDTRNGGTTGLIDRFNFTQSTADQGYWDDVAVNDTSGTVHNSWCGDGYGKLLVPNANGDSSQLVGSDTDSVDNYLLVDEVPYNTTDYVESATVGEKDLYHVAAPALAANEVINSVRVVAVAKLDTAGTGSIQVGIKTASEDWATALALNDVTWQTAHKLYEADPADGMAWSTAKVDTLQIGVKVA